MQMFAPANIVTTTQGIGPSPWKNGEYYIILFY